MSGVSGQHRPLRNAEHQEPTRQAPGVSSHGWPAGQPANPGGRAGLVSARTCGELHNSTEFCLSHKKDVPAFLDSPSDPTDSGMVAPPPSGMGKDKGAGKREGGPNKKERNSGRTFDFSKHGSRYFSPLPRAPLLLYSRNRP